jgi:urea carboxylase
MFTKVLIANRGAIAVRIIRTLREMGVGSVAVYSEADANSRHVSLADEAWSLGEGAAAQTYLATEKLFAVAKQAGAQAIHPGYGFLSENAAFAERCEAEGLVFLGPRPGQMRAFGLKHSARALAEANHVPLLPGTGLLAGPEEAVEAAAGIGYPVMLKSTAGGGGIGMSLCYSEAELLQAYASVKRLSENNFANGGLFLEKFVERARHIEVQVFGDGAGLAVALGERDCSAQRRNQKVVEETPAPNLPEAIRRELHRVARTLLAAVQYRSAGTVEFVVDQQTSAFYFLEVNTRLQVEHGVTEQVYGVDLVRWMIELGAGELADLNARFTLLKPAGHAIQVRLYAEDTQKDFRPSAGLLSEVSFPPADGVQVRIDHWISKGSEVSPWFDPMLAKVIVRGDTREEAISRLRDVLAETVLYGIETNRAYVAAILDGEVFRNGLMTTRYLNGFAMSLPTVDVLSGGTLTTVQDCPGRKGYWHVGVPPSGPFDRLSFQAGNRLLGNTAECAGLEITLNGPLLQFNVATRIVVTGAPFGLRLDGQDVSMNTVLNVAAGRQLSIGKALGGGARCYLLIQGGIDCPLYLGSRSTFTLGQFGGHNGRALRAGDVLHLMNSALDTSVNTVMNASPESARGGLESFAGSGKKSWPLRVIYGPHGAPDFFTDEDIATFFAQAWEVHYNSSRTGIRLIGPKPQWARRDGGDAGMHPSNIHDNAYAFGTVDFTGDMPVILGPDGPSLGGFVCPATVIAADLWKLGQLQAGDQVRFIAVSQQQANQFERAQRAAIELIHVNGVGLGKIAFFGANAGADFDTGAGFDSAANLDSAADLDSSADFDAGANAGADFNVAAHWNVAPLISPILCTLPAAEGKPQLVIRAAGDHFLLLEYGPLALDIELRFRVHLLMQSLQADPIMGIGELTPGIRSLQVHYDPLQVPLQRLLDLLVERDEGLGDCEQAAVPARVVHLPLSWDDEACQLAISKYMQSVRRDAPWCPSNLEFIRRINGLDSIDDVKRIVFDASYLVMGLGDVYLGAPVATPLDPRHRLVTTKYNPARTWTAENSVGIGGAYLCVYGMEGPGGYQFVGRTLQMWNRHKQTVEFEQPWLLRFFDQIRFFEVTAEELQRIRLDFPEGRYPLRIEPVQFSLQGYRTFLRDHQAETESLVAQRQLAFNAELQRWIDSGQINFESESPIHEMAETAMLEDGCTALESHVAGSVWQVLVQSGDTVAAGQTVMVLESMKMEIDIATTVAGVVDRVLRESGQSVRAGQTLMVIREA